MGYMYRLDSGRLVLWSIKNVFYLHPTPSINVFIVQCSTSSHLITRTRKMISLNINTMSLRLKLVRKTLFYQRYQFRCPVNITRFVSESDRGNLVKSIFSQNENNVMYQHLKLHQNYRQTLAFLDYVNEKSVSKEASAILNEAPSQIPKYQLVDDFKSICHFYCCDPNRLNEPNFVKFCEYLIDEIPQLQDKQLLNILKILTLWPRTEDSNNDLFYRICKAVDEETCKRCSAWNRNQLLLTIDHFHRAGVMNFSSFAWQNLGRLCRSPGRLVYSLIMYWYYVSDFFMG